MRKKDIVTGGLYEAKVSGRVVVVRVTGESRYGGWDATNTQTGRAIHVRSAQRFRRVVNGSPIGGAA